ncbi:MAG: group II intron reverse transcriptase/maturase [Rhabdochlamydiaceae bacterium]|nr:group II intron reverse transcriptase/maturase [Rhabdochlamydiaceae bacterium]
MLEKDVEIPNEKSESYLENSRRNLREARCCERQTSAATQTTIQNTTSLIEVMLERKNMLKVYKQVVKNRGAPGVDKMTTEDLKGFLKEHWLQVKDDVITGRYKPSPVKEVEIPKPGGGIRKLGIPAVVDRLLQQALHQILSPIFEIGFSESSYGFRPGRSAHQAVQKAKEYIANGKRWVVDMDLEKFFDRVNHDILMSRIARKVKDKRILLLIRRYLQAGIMIGGVETTREEGTPQGGPLSPLLSNIMLDDLDKELERRGHSFCRYADDCNIYVKSEAAGKRVMTSLKELLERRLKLKVNDEKSAVARPWNRKFLGYSVTVEKKTKLKVSPKAVERLKDKLKKKFSEGKGRNLAKFIKELRPILMGWSNYFKLAETKQIFEDLDGWIRRKLRCIIWKQKKRGKARIKMLMARGIDKDRAWKSSENGRGSWWNSGSPHMNEAFPKAFFKTLGLVSMVDLRKVF